MALATSPRHTIISTLTASLFASALIVAATGSLTHAATRPQGASATSTSATAPGQPKFGEAGPAVMALQKAIVGNGFTLVGGLTGKFSTQTLRALKNFQRVVGLPVTGIVDLRTATALKLIAKTPSVTKPATPAIPAGFTKLAAVPVRGARGAHVVALQKALIKAGVALPGGADGLFGKGTANALASFQKKRGLKVTGVLDAKTAKALKLALPSTSSPQLPTVPSTKPLLTLDTLPSFGQSNAQVRIVQNALVAAGVTVNGGVDGVFGVATRAAIRTYQRSHGLEVTGTLNLATALKLKLVAKPAVTLDVFPVQGICSYSDTWHDPRPNGRKHEGVDIIAAEGKLLYAVADGTITKVYVDAPDKISGNGVRLTKADGTYFFYGHMSKLADGIAVGSAVKAGQVIGYVGHTGDTSTNHLHFEVHPFGGDAVDPYPYVKAVDACAKTAPYGTAAN